MSAVTSLPPRETIGGFEEGISRAELGAVHWVVANPQAVPPGATMAADHRVSSLMWGLAGVHATWDYTPVTYHSEDATDALEELAAAQVPAEGRARVDYVFLSPQIEEGVTLVQWENSRPMTQAAIDKFDHHAAFQRIYEQDGVRIYRVDWAIVEQARAPLP